MQFSESWLRTFANPALSTEELAHTLTMSGLEVEDIAVVAPPFEGIVVARVLEVAKHPNADRLNVCKVDAGTGEVLNIVCGAPNVEPGILVPCALPGAILPPAEAGGTPFQIKATTMRGVASQGMLCSARELKLSEDHSGLMIFADNAPIGKSVREWLDLDDRILTLKLTPNKADCLSVLGVAREVAALTQVPLTAPTFAPVAVSIDDRLAVKVLAPDLCGRFSGRIIKGVDARATTPEWMKQRLARGGQRSISALVDISNYVMLELGRPTHIFDLGKIQGALEVRWGKANEKLELLNGNTIEVDETVGVIAAGATIESLAGIMGGMATAVSLDTTDIYVEAAFWWPAAVQGRARRYNFSTDAAHRFERGVDPETTVEHIEHITRLVLEICGGQAGPIDDQKPNMPVRKEVRMRAARAARIIGVELSDDVIADIFTRLNFAVRRDGQDFLVTAPSYRFDIDIEEDLIEEVARYYGFERIPAHLPVARHSMRVRSEARRSQHDLRDLLAASDYQEVLNFSFVEEQWEQDFVGNQAPIRLLNPIASQLAVMRSSLIGSLVANVRHNLNRKVSRVRIFEISKVFARATGSADGKLSVAGVMQPTRVAAIAYGPANDEQWGMPQRTVDFYDVKKDLENLFAPRQPRFVKDVHPALHPGRSARVELDGQSVGWLGELHPRWLQKYELPLAPVLFEIDSEVLERHVFPVISEISKFPAVIRDLAFVVKQDVPAQDFFDSIALARAASAPASLIQDVVLFDEFRGKGLKDNEKSLAFRFRLQDTQQTLSDEIVEQALDQIKAILHDKFGAHLR